jgi:inositol-hexakisphosphate kinase
MLIAILYFRYIGVLNVTFEKQLKRRTTTKGESESTVNGGGDVTAPQATDGTEAQTKPGSDSQSSLGPRPQSAGRSRVISQSLDVTQVPTPTVTFADNRHIIPKSFLQQQLQQQIPNIDRYRSLSDSGSVTDPGCRRLNQSQPTIPSKETMFRPALSDKHVASWGATTVNRKLRYEVFGEAFLQQPIPIQRHKKPAHQHRSLPHRQANANTLRTSNSETSLPEAAQRAQDEFTPKAESAEESMRMRAIKGSAERNGFRPSSADSPQKERAQLAIPKREASLPSDGTEANFEEHAGTSAPEADLLMETPKSKRKRRYSSGGLRRKPEEVADDRGSLKYFEEADDAGYAGDGEDDVFKMDSDPSTTPKSMPAATTKDSTVHSSASANPPHLYPSKSEPELTNEMVPAGRDVPVEEIPVLNRPVNPKEAQTQRDSRVEYFLLLEDLTAGMKRPCIMDLKMGTRQYGVDANTKKQLSQRRKCASTTSKELGVRVCGLQVWDVASQSYIFQDKYFGRDLKAGREFQDALTRFLYDGVDYSSVLRHIPTIIHKLSQLEVLIRHLKDYRFYAASLLLFYDGAYDDEGAITTDASTTNPKPPRGRDIDFKIADFANCVTAENGPVRDKPCPPQHLGEPDRGFLRGLRTLKTYFLNIQREVMEKERMVGAGAAQELQALDALDAQHTEDEGDVSY